MMTSKNPRIAWKASYSSPVLIWEGNWLRAVVTSPSEVHTEFFDNQGRGNWEWAVEFSGSDQIGSGVAPSRGEAKRCALGAFSVWVPWKEIWQADLGELRLVVEPDLGRFRWTVCRPGAPKVLREGSVDSLEEGRIAAEKFFMDKVARSKRAGGAA